MKEKLFFFSLKHPLLYILSLAIVLRILAVIFTSGYMIDDHYFNYYNIPLKWLDNPWLVYGVRLALGAFSLLIITLSYRITKIIADKTTALEIALLLTIWGLAPYLSVHPLPQTVMLPFILYGTLLIVKQDNLLTNNEIEKSHRTTYIISGFILGLGFAVYYQSLIYFIGVIIALIILNNKKGAIMTLIGYVIAVLLTQAIVDLIIWHRPFVNMIDFFRNSGDYLFSNIQNWNFEATSIFVLLFYWIPLSILLFVGFFKVWRKYMLLFLPTFLMILFYTIFPNRNAIYTFAIVPTFVIAGFVGWKEYYKNSSFWSKNHLIVKTCYVIFAIINVVVLLWTYKLISYD